MLSRGLGLIPPLLPINSAPGAKLHEKEREIRTVGKSLLYIPGLEASKRKNQTPQLFAARILGTTRKIFAKQFFGGFICFIFILDSFCFPCQCDGVWIFGGCIFMVFGFLLLMFAFCKFVVLRKS